MRILPTASLHSAVKGKYGYHAASTRCSVSGGCASAPRAPCVATRPRTAIITRAEGSGRNGDSFVAGMVVGGVVFGALGFLFAPQISKALLGDDQRIKLPRFLEDEQPKDPEQTKQDLIEKIAQLNASIDEVAAQLKVKEVDPMKMEGTV